MPNFAWLIENTEGNLELSKAQPHCCFAQFPGFGRRTISPIGGAGSLHPDKPFIFYAACNGSYEEALLWAEKVSESVLNKHGFTLKAFPADFPENPFKDLKAYHSYGETGGAHPFWTIEWPVGTQWDLVYAVTKLIFKNITYGKRHMNGDPHEDMIRILKEGGNIFEAMAHAAMYTGNGYSWPLVAWSEFEAKLLYQFTQKGPFFPLWDEEKKLGYSARIDINANHTPMANYQLRHGAAKSFGGKNIKAPLSQLREELRKAAGITDVSL